MTKTSALTFCLFYDVHILPNCLSCCVKNSCFAEETLIVMMGDRGMLAFTCVVLSFKEYYIK
jgi:hypothetical protein